MSENEKDKQVLEGATGNQPTPKNIPNAPKPIMWFSPDSMPTLPSSGTDYLEKKSSESSPILSVVVMVYKMPEQAKKTIYSLSACETTNVLQRSQCPGCKAEERLRSWAKLARSLQGTVSSQIDLSRTACISIGQGETPETIQEWELKT